MITVFVSEVILAMGVRGDGTRIIDLSDGHQFDVAAECSGIRSLSTMLALASVVAFMSFQRPWKRALVISAALPIAVISNVFRLLTIIVAKKNFGIGVDNMQSLVGAGLKFAGAEETGQPLGNALSSLAAVT